MGTLISFEGIDGSGKSFWAEKIANEIGKEAIYITRKEMMIENNKFLEEVEFHLKNVLWDTDNDSPIELLTDSGWLYLHLCWYHIYQENVLKPLLRKYKYVFIDGWYYKILARFLTKKEYSDEMLIPMFERLKDADKIIFLDVSIYKCFNRKKNFNQCEIGRLDGEEGEMRKSFMNYQEKVRSAYYKVFERNNIDLHILGDDINKEQILKLVL